MAVGSKHLSLGRKISKPISTCDTVSVHNTLVRKQRTCGAVALVYKVIEGNFMKFFNDIYSLSADRTFFKSEYWLLSGKTTGWYLSHAKYHADCNLG